MIVGEVGIESVTEADLDTGHYNRVSNDCEHKHDLADEVEHDFRNVGAFWQDR